MFLKEIEYTYHECATLPCFKLLLVIMKKASQLKLAVYQKLTHWVRGKRSSDSSTVTPSTVIYNLIT